MTGREFLIYNVKVCVHAKSLSIEGVNIYFDEEDDEKLAERIKKGLEYYRRRVNTQKREQFNIDNFY